MAGTIKRRLGRKEFAGICLFLLLAGALPSRSGHAEVASSANGKRQGKMMSLSIRIAQAQGNEGKVRKYKSLVRQHKARNKPPGPF